MFITRQIWYRKTSFPHASKMTLNSRENLETTVLRNKLRASFTPTPTTTLIAMTLCYADGH